MNKLLNSLLWRSKIIINSRTFFRALGPGLGMLLVLAGTPIIAQDEDGKDSKGGKSTVSDVTKKGSEADVNAGMTAKAKPTTTGQKMESHEKCPNCGKDVGKSESLKKGSFWSRLFPSKKDKKEKDPN